MTRPNVAAAALTLLLVACSPDAPVEPEPTTPQAAFPMTIVDDDGVEVTIAEPPMRIVTFAPSMTETLYALGVGDRIVGVSGDYDDFPPAALDLPRIGGAGEFGVDPNLEAVVALEPDLFVTIAGGDAWKSRLRELGVTVLTLDAVDLDDLMRDIEVLGAAVGAGEAAADLSAGMASEVRRIEEMIAGRPPIPCFYEVFYPPLIAAGPGTFIDDLLGRAGCASVTADATGAYPEWSVEDLVASSPEVYLVSAESASDPAAVASRAGFEAVAAIASGRIAILVPDLVSRPGPRILDGLMEIVRALHPDLA